MSNLQSNLLKQGLAEIARVGAAMVTIFTALWFFGAPAAREFVDDVITKRELASDVEVTELQSEMKELRSDQIDISKALERQDEKINAIKESTTEQRQLLNDILRELRKSP